MEEGIGIFRIAGERARTKYCYLILPGFKSNP